MSGLIGALVAFFLVDPLTSAMTERLSAARAPAAVAASLGACAEQAAPRLVERTVSDPLWAAGVAFRVWTGSASPETTLVEIAPDCAPAIRAARPFLEGEAA